MTPRRWILVVDDEPDIVALLEEGLAGDGWTVTTCHDARQAFVQARDLKPILVVSDLNMPYFGTGDRALKELRADPRLAGIPFLFVTGLEPEKAHRIVPQGDPKVRLLFKPVDIARVRAAARELTGLPFPDAGGGS